jgi:4-amino-4-deoxy-L-arabinose transferase-like glycosyltransferase
MPALPLMSYITAFLFSGVTSAKLFNWTAYLLCGAVVFSFVRNWFGLVPAAAAATLFLAAPLPLYEATTALIDQPLALFSAVAVLAVLQWTACDESGWLRLAGASLGFALGCKYHAAFWVLPLSIVIVWHSLRRKDPQAAIALRLCKFLGIAALLFSPWLARAWSYTGNPVFPLANGFFKSPWFTPAMDAAARAAYENEGVGTSLRALLALPWTVTFHPGPFRGTPGWIFPLGLLLSVARRPDPRTRYGLFTVLAFFYTWAVTAQEIRYLLPLMPLLAVLAAHGLLGNRSQTLTAVPSQSAGTSSRLARPVGALATCVATLGVLAFAASSWPGLHTRLYTEWTYWHSWKSPVRYLTGQESLQDYVKRDVPSIRVYDYANAHLASADRILLLNDSAQFYSRIPTLYSFTVEGERILLEESAAGVLRRLAGSRVTHVLLNYNGLAPLPRVAPRQGAYFFLDKRFQERYLETVYVDNNVFLFRVRI